jgi:hypothetical protein
LGIYEICKLINFSALLPWIPRSSRGMTIRDRSCTHLESCASPFSFNCTPNFPHSSFPLQHKRKILFSHHSG